MKIQISRLLDRIETLAGFNETPGNGVTRFSYSSCDRMAREYIQKQCEAMGLATHIDPLGNIRVRYEGQNRTLAPIWIGSHIDSVRNGGKYDGIVGVVSSMEVLNVLYENQVRPLRPIEMVIFAEEEGSNFGTTMLGSKAIVGKCDQEYLKLLQTEDGTTAFELTRAFGLHPENVQDCRVHQGEVYAMIELHIEQGIVLDREKLAIGVVQAIAGMETYRIEVQGESNHAGATPMNMRHDPMSAAAELICSIEKYAKAEVYDTTVATVGEIECEPNVANVIPKRVQFSVDIRDVRERGIESVASFIRHKSASMEQERGVNITMHRVGASKCFELAPRLIQLIEDVTRENGFAYKRMNSGAVHDAAMMAEITDVGMIFVPSVNGRSHNPEEFTEEQNLEQGAQALLDTVRRLMME